MLQPRISGTSSSQAGTKEPGRPPSNLAQLLGEKSPGKERHLQIDHMDLGYSSDSGFFPQEADEFRLEREADPFPRRW